MATIIILEDDPQQLKALSELFEKMGHTIFSFTNFKDLREYIECKLPCHAAFFDLALEF